MWITSNLTSQGQNSGMDYEQDFYEKVIPLSRSLVQTRPYKSDGWDFFLRRMYKTTGTLKKQRWITIKIGP